MYHYYSLVMTIKGEWIVGDTLDTDDLNNEDYKYMYQRLQAEGRKCSEIQAKELEVQRYVHQLQEKERQNTESK